MTGVSVSKSPNPPPQYLIIAADMARANVAKHGQVGFMAMLRLPSTWRAWALGRISKRDFGLILRVAVRILWLS